MIYRQLNKESGVARFFVKKLGKKLYALPLLDIQEDTMVLPPSPFNQSTIESGEARFFEKKFGKKLYALPLLDIQEDTMVLSIQHFNQSTIESSEALQNSFASFLLRKEGR